MCPRTHQLSLGILGKLPYFRIMLCSWEYFRMLLCSWEYFRMLLCSSWSSSGFMWMNGQICIWAFADECHMNFWVVLWRLSLYDFRMLLDQIFFEICLGARAWSHKVEMSLHFHALGVLVSFVQYKLPYVSKSCWIRLDLAFRLAFYFPTTVLFMLEKKHGAGSNFLNSRDLRMFLLFHLGWFVILLFDVIKS